MIIKEIDKRVKQIMSFQLGISNNYIKNNFYFLEDLGLDSLDMLDIVMALENEFNIEIPDEEIDKIKTVNQIILYINKNINVTY